MTPSTHEDEPHRGGISQRLNWLRAGVLGANDGIVSTAGLVIGVAGATSSTTPILIAGAAGLVAGAISMGSGEYVSVSTQRDSELALLEKERIELEEMPEEELAELAGIYQAKGLSPQLALEVATALTHHDALTAHAEAELGITPGEETSPWHAAWASMLSFTVGALFPLLLIILSPASYRVPVTVLGVMVALALTGWLSSTLGYGGMRASIARNMMGGLLAMAVTYGVGSFIGVHL